MLTALLDRYYRSIREGFPWKQHAELLPLIENGFVYHRKHTYVCMTCGFRTKGVPRHEAIIQAHYQEAIDCQTALPAPDLVRPFVYTDNEIKLLSHGLSWTQACYELTAIRRLMGYKVLRRQTWEAALFDPLGDAGTIRDYVDAGLWHNTRLEAVECVFCTYLASTTGANHLVQHSMMDNCPAVRHEEYAAMMLLAPLEAAPPRHGTVPQVIAADVRGDDERSEAGESTHAARCVSQHGRESHSRAASLVMATRDGQLMPLASCRSKGASQCVGERPTTEPRANGDQLRMCGVSTELGVAGDADSLRRPHHPRAAVFVDSGGTTAQQCHAAQLAAQYAGNQLDSQPHERDAYPLPVLYRAGDVGSQNAGASSSQATRTNYLNSSGRRQGGRRRDAKPPRIQVAHGGTGSTGTPTRGASGRAGQRAAASEADVHSQERCVYPQAATNYPDVLVEASAYGEHPNRNGSTQTNADVQSLDSTIDDGEQSYPVFSMASQAHSQASRTGALSSVVRRLEQQGFPKRRIINTLSRLPEEQMGNIDAFYVVNGAAVPEPEAINEDFACTICFLRQVTVMPNGCGDFKFCAQCLPDAGTCPLCRMPYDKKIVVRTEFLG